MKADVVEIVSKISSNRESRDFAAALIFKNPEWTENLVQIAFDTSDENHIKACWILELVLEKNTTLIIPYLDFFCEMLPLLSHESALRPISKICFFISKSTLQPNENQLKQIIESCFDWLITDVKVATKVYAMRTLFELGKTQSWIYPELREILSKDFAQHSAAYRVASKEILRKIVNY